MASRIGGSRRKSRHKLKKDRRDKGKLSTSRHMQKFEIGKKVYLNIESSIQKGAYPTRFMGKVGVIKKQAGNCYGVSIKEGRKNKLLIVHPVHLKKV